MTDSLTISTGIINWEKTFMGKTMNPCRVLSQHQSQRQSHRSNIPTTSAEDYYRISLYNEFVSHVIADLRERYIPAYGIGLSQLVPSQCCNRDTDFEIPEDLTETVDFSRMIYPMLQCFRLNTACGSENGSMKIWKYQYQQS